MIKIAAALAALTLTGATCVSFPPDPAEPPQKVTCAPMTMSAADIAAADYGKLVMYLTSNGVGVDIFYRNKHRELKLEYVREMARCLVWRRQGKDCPPK